MAHKELKRWVGMIKPQLWASVSTKEKILKWKDSLLKVNTLLRKRWRLDLTWDETELDTSCLLTSFIEFENQYTWNSAENVALSFDAFMCNSEDRGQQKYTIYSDPNEWIQTPSRTLHIILILSCTPSGSLQKLESHAQKGLDFSRQINKYEI